MRCQLGPAKHDLYHHQSNHVLHGYYLTEVLTQWFQMMHRIIDNLLVSILCCLKRQNSDKLSFQQASIAINFLTNISSSVFICAGICTYTTLFSIHHNKYSRHLRSDCLHNFLVLLPAHSKAKGFLCDLQCAADGNGWVTGKTADVFMGDLESVTVGIVDLRERKGVRPHLTVTVTISHVYCYFCIKHPFINPNPLTIKYICKLQICIRCQCSP